MCVCVYACSLIFLPSKVVSRGGLRRNDVTCFPSVPGGSHIGVQSMDHERKNRGSRITATKISFSQKTEISKLITRSYTRKRIWRKKNRERLSQGMPLLVKLLSINDSNHSEDPRLKSRRIEWQVKSRISVNDSSSSRVTQNLHGSQITKSNFLYSRFTENQLNCWREMFSPQIVFLIYSGLLQWILNSWILKRNQNPIRPDQEALAPDFSTSRVIVIYGLKTLSLVLQGAFLSLQPLQFLNSCWFVRHCGEKNT